MSTASIALVGNPDQRNYVDLSVVANVGSGEPVEQYGFADAAKAGFGKLGFVTDPRDAR